MTDHAAVIAAGPGCVQRLCCGTDDVDETVAVALDAIDDAVALVDEVPVAVESLWAAVLRQLAHGHRDGSSGAAVVVHPCWWSASRVAVLSAATRSSGKTVQVRPRSWLLERAGAYRSVALVEIADRLVAVTGPDPDSEVVALPRLRESRAVADEVARVISRVAGTGVVIDAPEAVAGAASLAALIAHAVGSSGRSVVVLGDTGLKRLARIPTVAESDEASAPADRPRSRSRVGLWPAAAGVVLMVLAGLAAGVEPRPPPIAQPIPPTVLVEGRVALTIPAGWRTQRIFVGPGSARVQVTSPADAEVALHLTQSPTPGETLPAAADLLKRAMDAEPAGVFVDFNPSGVSAGRPAVTYREVRATHHVRWTVLLDGPVRISVGCQSRPGAQDAVSAACEEAVRSAHVLD